MIFNFLKNLGSMDPDVKACVDDVIRFLRANQQAKAEQIAEVYKQHGRTQKDISEVTKYIRPRLKKTHINGDTWEVVMVEVRKAKLYLPLR